MNRIKRRSIVHWFRKTSVLCAATLLAISSVASIHAADLMRISPVSDKILMLHFSEGHVDFPSLGQDWRTQKLYYDLLSLDKATSVANYTLKSANDANYGGSGKHPVRLGRKAKMAHVGDMFRDDVPNYLLDHWVFLEMPTSLEKGKNYTLDMADLASNANRWSFTYDPETMVSEAIRLNQIGFRPDAKKYAYLSQYMGDFNSTLHANGGLNLDAYIGGDFRVVRIDNGQTVFTGTIAKQKAKTSQDTYSGEFGPNKNFSNADVYECNFSALTTPGHYKIVVDRMGCSYPFTIQEDVYRQAYQRAMRALFFQRANVYKQIPEYGSLVYPASHPNNKRYYDPSKGRQEVGGTFAKDKLVDGIWGWYFDAGDWDTYCWTHSKVPALLLLAYELNPAGFVDGDVGNKYKRNTADPWIDEGTNGIPDILDEASWYIKFLRRSREALVSAGYGTGGVPAYAGIDAGAIDGKSSWTDDRDLVVTKEDAGVTALYAGLAAWLGVSLKKAGRPDAEVTYWINDAKSAYTWAKSHGATGGDLQFGAAGLYRGTSESSYQTDYIASYSVSNWEYWSGPEWDQLAALLYATLPVTHPGLNAGHQQTVRGSVKQAADNYWVNEGLTRGFRATHIAPYQRNMLGVFSTPRTLMPAVYYAISGESKYRDATQFAADYVLGGNQMGMVWMSGVGWCFDREPFHPDSWYLIDYNHKAYLNLILPGYVSYGTHASPDWWGWGYSWEGDEDFSRSSAYPVIENNNTVFPAGEQRFPNRVNIPASEFTIHQNQLHSIFTYGCLLGTYAGSSIPAPPTVRVNLTANQTIGKENVYPLTVQASVNTYRVDYYADWHFLGSSTDAANQFRVDWKVADYKVDVGMDYLITAKAYTIGGLISQPTPIGEAIVRIVSGAVPVYPLSAHPRQGLPQVRLSGKRLTVSDASRVLVVDSKGATRLSRALSSSSGSHPVSTFDCSRMSAGVYVVHLEGGGGKTVSVLQMR